MLVGLFVCRKYTNGQKGDKYGHMEQVDMIGGLGPTAQPLMALPRHQSMGSAPEPITSFHSSQFDQRTRFDAGGFMGPLS